MSCGGARLEPPEILTLLFAVGEATPAGRLGVAVTWGLNESVTKETPEHGGRRANVECSDLRRDERSEGDHGVTAVVPRFRTTMCCSD